MIKCKMPKMSNHRGRTWDTCYVLDTDNLTITGFLDTTWGEYVYILKNNQWYKFKFSEYEDISYSTGMTNYFNLNKKVQL